VIKVTNLNTSGPGSLQAACSAEGPRIVVFDVSGVIHGDVRIEHGQITIAGQTAPGGGITIEGMLRGPAYNWVRDTTYIEDVVVRFLRIRPLPGTSVPGRDWDAIQLGRVNKAVIDHVSCSWANDETIDIYVSRNVTIQWCTIEESDPTGHHKGQHNFGLIGGPRSWNVSLHHTLFANHRRRCPAFANGPADIRNIVVYNFRDGLSHEGHPPNNRGFNLIGNYYKAGPSDPNIFPFCFVDTISYYLRDNYIEGVGMIQNPWAESDKLYGLRYYAHKGRRAGQETPVPPVTTFSPQAAYSLVLEKAGCFPRDSVTRRTINEVRNGTGEWRRRDPGDLMAGLTPRPPMKDTDNDGMPDCWEEANGLDPTDSGDHNRVMASGYTAVEEYCNMRARELIEKKGWQEVKSKESGTGCRPSIKGIKMVRIPGGSFQIGGTGQGADELPVHKVTFDAFCMSETEITVGQVLAVSGKAGRGLSWTLPPRTREDSLRMARWDSLRAAGADSPERSRRRAEYNLQAAVAISWNGAVVFCNELSKLAGLEPCYDLESWVCDFSRNGFRLPTEAEWEYACRAGTSTAYCTGDDPRGLERVAWFGHKTENPETRLVRCKQPNAFGLYDMHGNVWEWCNDWYRHDYYAESPQDNPQGPPDSGPGKLRVNRGGSRSSSPLACRSAVRRGNPPSTRNSTIGFRIVRTD